MMKTKLILILAGLLTLACSFTVSMDTKTEEEALKEMLTGREAVIFGGEEFIAKSQTKLENYGMSVQTAGNLESAILLAGDGFVELHCVQYFDQEIVVVAQKPSDLLNIQPPLECGGGLILVGFSTNEEPDIVVPSR